MFSMSLVIALSFADSALFTEIRSKRRKHEDSYLEATICAMKALCNESMQENFLGFSSTYSFFPAYYESDYYITINISNEIRVTSKNYSQEIYYLFIY